MGFVDFLRRVVVDHYPAMIGFNEATNSYFFGAGQKSTCLEQFLNDLEKDLLLPIHQKSLKFDKPLNKAY